MTIKDDSPPRAASPRELKPIPVAELRFTASFNVPLRDCSGGMQRVSAGPRPDSRRMIEIHFEPWMRHYRVREYFDPLIQDRKMIGDATIGDRKLLSEFLVHESCAIGILFWDNPQ